MAPGDVNMNEIRKRFETDFGRKVKSNTNAGITGTDGANSHRNVTSKTGPVLTDATSKMTNADLTDIPNKLMIPGGIKTPDKVTSAVRVDTPTKVTGVVRVDICDQLTSSALTENSGSVAVPDKGKRKPAEIFTKEIIKLPLPKLSHATDDAHTDGRSDETQSESLPRGLPVQLQPSGTNVPSGKRFLGSKGRSLSDTSKMYRGSFDSGLDKSETHMFKTGSLNIEDPDMAGLRRNPYSSSIKRRQLRRRQSKRFEKPDEKKPYGNDTETYEAIRERIMREKAVVNAIEALQERWRMIMFMYDDSVDLNAGRIERQHTKLTVKRQEELVILLTIFLVLCVPVMVVFLIVCRL